MSLELVALLVSIVSMVAAILAIPSIHEKALKFSPILAIRFKIYGTYILAVSTTATVIILVIYRQFFYPCPWYEINALRADAARLGSSQPSMISQIGEKLCDCGAEGEGWDWQARGEYWTQQYRMAIKFWRKSSDADPSRIFRNSANIADASIWLGDYLTAKELYKKSYESDKHNEHFRYGFGRALTYSGDYKEAINILSGMSPTFSDGGSTGQTLILEGIARLGSVRSIDNTQDRQEQINIAKSKFCSAIAINHNWKEWLVGSSVGLSNHGNLQVFKDLIRPMIDIDCR